MLKDALQAKDRGALKTAALAFDLALMTSPEVEMEVFADLSEIILSEAFCRFSEPEILLNVLAYNLQRFSAEQRAGLAKIVESAYPRLESEASCMLSMEMLAALLHENEFVNFADRAAKLDVRHRAIVAYGLGHFLKSVERSDETKQSALRILGDLARDSEADVRSEAAHVLKPK
jgi:hypothetical protein